MAETVAHTLPPDSLSTDSLPHGPKPPDRPTVGGGGADAWARRILRIRPGPPASEQEAQRLFSVSMALSGVRCLLTYIIFPIAGPAAGFAGGGEPAITIPLGLVALFFDVRALRRFWLADHAWRWWITALYLVVMAMVLGLLVSDFVRLA